MKANIKYNYIPKGKITISTLTQMFELTEEEIYNIGIIDNASKGLLPLSKKYNVTFIINEELSSNIKNRVSMNIISLLDCKDEV